MGDDDKPFACPQPGCGMRFVNEDHLSVHKMKHEMSLTLTPGTRLSNNLIVDFSADQTPTPTKFLRNCEEIGLFSELTPSKNPFEDAFKKATQENLSHVPTEILVPQIHVPVDVQTLHTPIPPPVTLPADSSQAQPEFIPLPGPTTDSGSTISSSQASPSPPNKITDTEVAIDLTMSSSIASEKVKIKKDEAMSPVDVVHSPSSEPEDSLSAISSSSCDTIKREDPVMVTKAFPSMTTQPLLVTSPKQDVVGTVPALSPQIVTSPVAPQQSNLAIAAPMTATIRPQYLMQVMLQLPNGQTVPVQIPTALSAGSPVAAPANVHPQLPQPAQPQIAQTQPQPVQIPNQIQTPLKQEPVVMQSSVAVTTVAATASTITRPAASIASVPLASPVAEVSTTSSSQNNASAMTKQKLKAAITQNVQQSVLQNNMRVMSEAVERVIASPAQRPQTLLKTSPGGGLLIQSAPSSASSSPNAVQTQAADTSTPFGSKRARKSSEDDPDERRRKFLERNRAAAARCRNKRRQWIANLERKADDINGVNGKLQTEIAQLRAEVAQLKSLLLAHKDCPVFVQQRDSGQINLETVRVQNVEVNSEGQKVSVPTELVTVNLSSNATSNSEMATTQIVPQTIISVIEENKILVKQS